MDSSLVSFVPVDETHFELLHEWLNNEHVVTTYGLGKRPSLEEVTEKYRSQIADSTVREYIISYDGRPIGFIQTYKLADHPDYQKQINFFENSAGVDLFIGDPNFTGKGLGPIVIRKFVEDIVFKIFDVESAMTGPAPSNTRSVKAFGKAGFEYVKTAIFDGMEECIMRLSKTESQTI